MYASVAVADRRSGAFSSWLYSQLNSTKVITTKPCTALSHLRVRQAQSQPLRLGRWACPRRWPNGKTGTSRGRATDLRFRIRYQPGQATLPNTRSPELRFECQVSTGLGVELPQPFAGNSKMSCFTFSTFRFVCLHSMNLFIDC